MKQPDNAPTNQACDTLCKFYQAILAGEAAQAAATARAEEVNYEALSGSSIVVQPPPSSSSCQLTSGYVCSGGLKHE